MNTDIAKVFQVLADQEEKHKQHIWEMYQSLHGGHLVKKYSLEGIGKWQNLRPDAHRISAILPKFSEVLDFPLSLETDSLGLYLKLAQKTPDNEAGDLFNSLAEEEKST
jgi:rubrerythrin